MVTVSIMSAILTDSQTYSILLFWLFLANMEGANLEKAELQTV